MPRPCPGQFLKWSFRHLLQEPSELFYFLLSFGEDRDLTPESGAGAGDLGKRPLRPKTLVKSHVPHLKMTDGIDPAGEIDYNPPDLADEFPEFLVTIRTDLSDGLSDQPRYLGGLRRRVCPRVQDLLDVRN